MLYMLQRLNDQILFTPSLYALVQRSLINMPSSCIIVQSSITLFAHDLLEIARGSFCLNVLYCSRNFCLYFGDASILDFCIDLCKIGCVLCCCYMKNRCSWCNLHDPSVRK